MTQKDSRPEGLTPGDEKLGEALLEDLLSGKERLLTAGEVGELLNVNTNTLYLWRVAGDKNLPYQVFKPPGNQRGMVRYKYSDVAAYLAGGIKAGEADQAEHEPKARKKTGPKTKRKRSPKPGKQEHLLHVLGTADYASPAVDPRFKPKFVEMAKEAMEIPADAPVTDPEQMAALRDKANEIAAQIVAASLKTP